VSPSQDIADVTSPYCLFKYSVRSEITRKYYERRIRRFLDFIEFSSKNNVSSNLPCSTTCLLANEFLIFDSQSLKDSSTGPFRMNFAVDSIIIPE